MILSASPFVTTKAACNYKDVCFPKHFDIGLSFPDPTYQCWKGISVKCDKTPSKKLLVSWSYQMNLKSYFKSTKSDQSIAFPKDLLKG